MNYTYSAYPWGRWIKWGVIALVVVILLGSLMSTYNGLTTADQNIKSRWSQVENVMQRRADTINNLVETVKGYTKHEEEVFGKVAAARSVLLNSSDNVKEKLNADSDIANATKDVLLLVENYPDLKASEQFSNLQVAIEGSENRVSVERKRFIEAVEAYNIKVTRFPGNVFARVLGFAPKDYFQASPDAQKAPEVKF